MRYNNVGNMRQWYDAATGEMGTQVKLLNNSGTTTVKGYLACPSSNIDRAFVLVGVNDPDPNWVIYEDGVPDGQYAWCWLVNSICQIYLTANSGNPTRHYLVRALASGDTATTAGQALAELLPTGGTQTQTDKHFLECGHVMESRVGNGLALCSFHTN